MEEVTGGNITASYRASLKKWLGPWAEGRGEEIQSGKWKERRSSALLFSYPPPPPPLLPLLSSSQTDSQLGCDLWGEEASLFLLVSLHPPRVDGYIQHHISRILYYVYECMNAAFSYKELNYINLSNRKLHFSPVRCESLSRWNMLKDILVPMT